jgi:DNA replication protein DnaC
MKRPIRPVVTESSLILMGVPKHFCKVTLDDFKTYSGVEEVKMFVKDYISHLYENIEENRGIFFCGSNGVGKSMLSCIILKEAYRRRFSCRRITFSQYISYYTEAWNVRDKQEKEVLENDFYEKYKGVEFLVLEEIGKEIDSKIAQPILEDLLRYREEHGLVTIICSNIDMKVIEEKYGSSIASLCKGHMTPVTIVGKDMRYSR